MKVCRIGRVYDWKSVKLEGCRIGMYDFMDYIGSIIFGIFLTDLEINSWTRTQCHLLNMKKIKSNFENNLISA